MTIAALFSTFNFSYTDFDRDGFPNFASCLLIELWRRSNDSGAGSSIAAGAPYVKVWYRRDFHGGGEGELIDVTDSIKGCTKECPLERFAARSLKYKPTPSQEAVSRYLNLLNINGCGDGWMNWSHF